MIHRHPVVQDRIGRMIADRQERGFSAFLTQLEHRQNRILTQIFEAIEPHRVTPHFDGTDYVFIYFGVGTKCSLEPFGPGPYRPNSKLRFTIEHTPEPEDRFCCEWTDGDASIEDQIPEIVSAIVVVARHGGRLFRDRCKFFLEKELLKILDSLKFCEAGDPDGIAAQHDPRTFDHFIKLAERHRSALMARRFTRTLERQITDGSLVVANRTLDEWMQWIEQKTTELDPLTGGPKQIFEQLSKF